MAPAAVIFDLDGLLIDSEPHWRAAEIEVFARAGLALTEDDCAATTGLRIDAVVRLRAADPAWQGITEAEAVTAILDGVVARVRSQGEARPGMAHALGVARGTGAPLALASSSPARVIHAALERLGLADAFAVVQSAENLPFGKPHPEVYLRTAERLGVPATECVALEDSVHGMVAAKAARMRCVAVPERFDPRFALADVVLASLDALDARALGGDYRC